LITSHDEEFIPLETLNKGRELVNTAVKLINGYMNYLKRAEKNPSVDEDTSPYETVDPDPVDSDNSKQ